MRESPDPNPRRVLAGRANRAQRPPLSAESRQTLRTRTLQVKPWTVSTGPKTAAGKARSSANGRRRQKGAISVRQLRADLAAAKQLIRAVKRFLATVRDSG